MTDFNPLRVGASVGHVLSLQGQHTPETRFVQQSPSAATGNVFPVCIEPIRRGWRPIRLVDLYQLGESVAVVAAAPNAGYLELVETLSLT